MSLLSVVVTFLNLKFRATIMVLNNIGIIQKTPIFFNIFFKKSSALRYQPTMSARIQDIHTGKAGFKASPAARGTSGLIRTVCKS